ncbi:Beta-lactamase/transpeptidase-like protein [Akanthomyces lecanii RCEF 1005]|uniref:Beta-lactamase/transpeptidase-like protein n=1 Tax=Akanthomyces lecanii RCEF 1005 TaxID=1081108 RepID=A0A168CQ28_CORDF|nr:Beta-lactamase/transpeptidase-like protein [Akanthomyces lecanii RCEF 1005]
MDLFESSQFTDHVNALMAEHHVPGLSVAIAVGDSATAARGFGYASVERNEPCTPETIFDIASSAKSLTAAAVALLVDDNKNHPNVQYDAAMSALLADDFVMPETHYTDGVTVEDVLSHRTGMASHDNSYMGKHATQPDDARSITRNLRNLAVAAPLRSRYLYCNMMYTAATHLVEVESGMPFARFLEDRVFNPLGMNSTALQPALARERGLGDRIAKGHLWNKTSYDEFDSPDCPEGQGAGSVMSSAADFIKWVKALMNREFPINDKVYQGLTRMRSIVNPGARRLKPHTTPAIYAAGMEVYYYRGQMLVGHDGNIAGFGSRFVFLPDKRLGVVVMGNSPGAGALSTAVIRALVDEVLGLPASERQLRTKPKEEKLRTRPAAVSVNLTTENAGDKGSYAMAPGTKKKHARNAGKPVDAASKASANERKAEKPSKQKAKSLPPQEVPLDAYIGTFTNIGYKNLTVEMKDEALFVDARDRAFGFTLSFEHKRHQREYIAHLCDALEGGDDPMDAEFVFEDDRAVRLGLDLEPAIRDLIWFDLVRDAE